MEELLAQPQAQATAEDWSKALERVVPCCLVLKVTQTRAMDTEAAGSSYATGFIVDKKRGIILTNRHVVTPGPIVAEAIFLNREELPVVPVYYDPVHDFAFLRFDPSKLQFMEVGEVPLNPAGASVGLDIRVVGNDSGEKVSILAGTLARLDRDAPSYGRKGFNDFNTFYLQAASGTKGGSSGSPVVNCHGQCIGLNAGGKNKAASAYYLPLERVVRALRLIQEANEPGTVWKAPCIPRGDLQTTLSFKGFDEVRRLGLQTETEAIVRAAPARSHGAPAISGAHLHTVGMLVVESVVPRSPADGVIEPGDVLVHVDGQVVTHFLHLEELLDAAVGGSVALEVERGGVSIAADVEVTDLHSVTPSTMLEVAGGVVHALSYQQARNNRAAVGQVYVAEPGYMLGKAGVPKYAIITALNGAPVPDTAAFAGMLRQLAHGARVPLEYYTFHERNRRKNVILQVDRHWYGPPVSWTRDDTIGAWHPTTDYPPGSHECAAEKPAVEVAAATAAEAKASSRKRAAAATNGATANSTATANGASAKGAATANCAAASVPAADGSLSVDAFEARMRRCLCLVDVDVPLVGLTDGVHSRSFAGNGLVVFHGAETGLVLVDRNTVAIGCCDVNISFGAHPAEIAGTVRFLHPLHNFALVSYRPSDLPPEACAKVCAAQLLAGCLLKRGDGVRLVGLTKSLRIMQRSSVVTNATAALTIQSAEVPRFRAVHEEVVKLDHDFGSSFSGVLTDGAGAVRAMWASYAEQVDKDEREWCAGLPTHVFWPWVQRLINMEAANALAPPTVRVLDAELEAVLLSKAAQFGLPAKWIQILDNLDPDRRQVLRVRSTTASSSAASVLQSGDMLLAVEGEPVTCFGDVEGKLAAMAASSGASSPLVAEEAARPAKRTRRSSGGGVGAASNPVANDAANGTANGAAKAEANGVVDGAAPSVSLTVFRGGAVLEVKVVLGAEDGMGTNRLVHWCGAQLQAPHRAVRELGFLPEGAAGVYISRWHHGSPAHRFGLYALHFIMEVNGVATPDLDTFLGVVKELKDGDFARVKMCHLETTQQKVLTLKMDHKYWPTWELQLDRSTCVWKRVQISPYTH